jgi:hypothetical protein
MIRHATTFRAWRIAGTRNEAIPLPMSAADLPAAVAATVTSCQHKEAFVVVEHDAVQDRSTAHFYAVKRKSQARYVLVDHVTQRVHDLYAEPLFSLAVNAFDPVEPWSWSLGADVVGMPKHAVLS